MCHLRRLLQCFFLIGILLKSSVYLWNRKVEFSSASQQQVIHSTTKELHVNAIDGLELTANSSASSCGDEIQPIVGIEPFPDFQLNASNMEIGNMLQTYDWWDLWNGDSNCTRHQVHLLKEGSEPEPGAFVSFPGSGNTWIRSLLMGITGVYVTSLYTDESRSRVRPEGTGRNFLNATSLIDPSFYSESFPFAINGILLYIIYYLVNRSYEIRTDCGCSLLQKTHDFSLDGNLYTMARSDLSITLNKFKSKGILVIRNPFKAIQSYLNFIYGGMKGTAPSSAFKGESKFEDFPFPFVFYIKDDLTTNRMG